ncbi:TIGR04282 family arsenosugar biosynthesis glycosyltransferase [Polaribacter sp. HL-MS24]|uniref:TIGR04282 family arsenosugar biosynthesis glycosyltransferase n=1 Tax=Polaribacter sp. HL-MS24 TaxID=3077735 RepID=UPI002934CE01|nr:TIGR04282 family arsenosugar biosynthesis glycosyltransferase [Polaribacter sp. HL-MS24]WOC40859.1 TIGR04282 family arsenosugar biosynthesis glycosyltransferase [Polaribacter sp. HL-MS24]
MTKNLLLIFTRNPELGAVKTRLAKTIGDKAALSIYLVLLNHTHAVTQNLSCDKAVYYSVKVRDHDLWNPTHYLKKQQFGADLGIRMQNAFQDSFNAGYQKVIVIGSDLIDLSEELIETAFLKLDSNEVVIGPAEDGGYYLLGLKELEPKLFTNKKWGTASVRSETLSDLKDKKVHLLETLNDIDVFEDIKGHPSLEQFLE